MIRTRLTQFGTISNYNLSHKHNTFFSSEKEKERYIHKYINTLSELGIFNNDYTSEHAYNALKLCEDKNKMSQIFATIRDKGGK